MLCVELIESSRGDDDYDERMLNCTLGVVKFQLRRG